MSWIDSIKNDLIITCGDGKKYRPSWLNATKELEWNVAMFEFPELDGTLVKKTKKMGTKFALELYFQGEDHIDVSRAFEQSNNDSRPWVMEHPYYGRLVVQAPKFKVDNSRLNLSVWTGTVIETIFDDNPKTQPDPIGQIALQKNLLDESFANALFATPTPSDVNSMTENNNSNYNLTVPQITIPEQAEAYYNVFKTANAAVSTATSNPLLAMRTTIAMISAPAQFTLSVKQRVEVLTRQLEVFRTTLTGITDPSTKEIYQNSAGSIISSMCYASTLPLDGGYTNSNDVLGVVGLLISNYDTVLADLDSIQTANGGAPTSFIPNSTSLIGLGQMVSLAVSNLFNIALLAKNERQLIVENDTNFINLTHRLYGLDGEDNNLEELIANNNLGLNGLLQIRKGTTITYYI